jgi:hypothetical protein
MPTIATRSNYSAPSPSGICAATLRRPWGLLGGEIADTWRKFNAAYFNDALWVISPIVSQALPPGSVSASLADPTN